MTSPPRLQYGQYYHIYNRGNNRADLFFEERNYHYFLQLYAKHVLPIADTYAYCLLKNHFHTLVRIKTMAEQEETFRASGEGPGEPPQTLRVSKTLRVCGAGVFKALDPSQQFGNLFNAYAKAINKAYKRSGSLFENPFGRVPVDSDAYFTQLITYIHHNPQKHRFVPDFRDWPFSSYHTLMSTHPTRLKRDDVLAWYQGTAAFQAAHQCRVNEGQIRALVEEDFD